MDEATATDTGIEAQESTEQAAETNWQAKYEEMRTHSREWEKLAKANKAAADELDALKQAQMTETEKLNARAEKAEAELAALKAAAAAQEHIANVAKDSGVPSEILGFCADTDKLDDFAAAVKAYAQTAAQPQQQVPPVAFSTGARIVSGNEKKISKSDQFAAALEAAGL